MPEKAKRFYLCNLIPLWQIDERDMDVDWPVFHAYFGDLIPMKADVQRRKIRWTTGDGVTVDPDLKIRFEINESDFLLSGGLNDHMNTFSSHTDFGDDVIHRPIKIVADVDKIPEEDQRKFIFIHWIDAHEESLTVTAPDGTSTTKTEQIPDTLQVRCFWTVVNPEGGDVKGNPEFYYDVYIEGKLENGDDVDLHERSDHELEGFAWHVTDKPRKGRVTPLVDGEYAFLTMLQLIDGAQHSIHILNWKIDPQATLVIEPEFQADYLQAPGLDAAGYAALIARCKPLTTGVAIVDGIIVYGASNGNVIAALDDGSATSTIVRHYDDPTNLDLPSGILALNPAAGVSQMLVLDQLRSQLLLFVVVKRSELRSLAPGMFALQPISTHGFIFFEVTPTLPGVMSDPDLVAGFIVLAGNGNPGHVNGPLGLHAPTKMVISQSAMNRPADLAIAKKTLFITDTGNHCLRHITSFDPTDVAALLRENAMDLGTFAGTANSPGNTDGTGAAARFNTPTGIVFDEANDRLIVADTGNHRLRAVSLSGAVTTLAVTKIDGAANSLGEVAGLAIDPATHTLFVVERDRHRILAVDLATLEATTLAGSTSGVAGFQDGPAASARFRRPIALAFGDGLLCVSDSENHVVRVIELATGTVRTIGSPTVAQEHDVPVVLADVLRRKAAAGVAVRILLDGFGSGIGRLGWLQAISISGKQTEADFHFFDPRIQVFVQNHVQTIRDQQLASYHEKMMVVDGKAGVAGGIDFAPDKNDGILHDRKHRGSLFWHDVAALVEGPAAFGLEEHFNRRWQMAREEITKDKDEPVKPGALQPVDRTDSALERDEAETVRTFDPTPLLGFLVNLRKDEIKEILESYKRGILAARHYIYLEHQYLYYPEIGEYCAQAMKDNPRLQVIWTIPFFTEETFDPTQEHLRLVEEKRLADSITDGKEVVPQLKSQLAWHGFFRHHEMVENLRQIDRNRFGLFSIQKLFTPTGDIADVRIEQIYPHSKMLLCDDRFFSIGSANANGRGFTKDGEVNISARAPVSAKALRERLWGEHLGYLGVAFVTDSGRLLPVTGHHLKPGDTVQLRHPALGGEVAEKVAAVDATSGAVEFEDGPLDPAHGRVFSSDPTLADLPLDDAVAFWRRSAHSLATFRKVKGAHATTNAAGDLVIPGNLAESGDKIAFGMRYLQLNDDGSARKSEPVIQKLRAATMEVESCDGDRITLKPAIHPEPDDAEIRTIPDGGTKNIPPFIVRVLDRPDPGVAQVELRLIPNQKDVPFDYTASWLLRQPGGLRGVRAWEIDPSEGIEYAGPGSRLFNPWMNIPLLGLPWFIIDFDPDEQARLEVPGGIRLA
jgi:phosphatidylserine/phosphatidylglycerophosphate/cardiolipin synthase-like enzyme